MRRLASSLLAAAAISAALVGPLPAEPLRVLTYNLWHGFWRTADKEVLIVPSEPMADRARRQSVQVAELERLRPDLLLAQEVHPLPWRARELARGLGHSSIHQLVSCGVRFLHLGVPWAVRSGLVVTAAPELELERLSAPVLSGRFSYCNDWVGLQLEEARRALLGRIQLAGGRRLLIVTTHLHSSTEGGTLRADRRSREVEALLAAIDEARRRDPAIEGVILGGDFNALSESEAVSRLVRKGYVDVARFLDAEFPTYDPWVNDFAAQMTRAGGGDPSYSPPRRIDYLFVSRELEAAIRSVDRYGFRDGHPEPVDSDHFGVLLEIELD